MLAKKAIRDELHRIETKALTESQRKDADAYLTNLVNTLNVRERYQISRDLQRIVL